MSWDCREASGRERLGTQKRRIATSDTHELTDATTLADAVDRQPPFHRDMSLDRDEICVGEHRQEEC
jgi:hypothetical protein